MSHFRYPHTIENGAGERITFLGRVSTPGGDRLEIQNVVTPGAGPPMHIHHYQEEVLTVEQGRIGYQRPGEPPHLRCTGYIEPADNVEYFLTELYASTRRSGGRRPDPFEAAFLIRRYRSEFALVDIPAVVQRFIVPVQVTVGRLLGRHRRYAGAPAPVRRGPAPP